MDTRLIRYFRKSMFFLLTASSTLLVLFGNGYGESTLNYGHFQDVRLAGNQYNPAHIILYAYESDTPELNDEIVRTLAATDNLVIQIDVNKYLEAIAQMSDSCVYAAGDFETLSQYLQRKLGLTTYRHTILVGHGRGASLIYGVLAEAPQTFPGAISIDFRPDLAFSKDLCDGKKLHMRNRGNKQILEMLPTTDLNTPWIVINTEREPTADPREVQSFVEQVDSGKFNILLDKNRKITPESELITKLNESLRTIEDAQSQNDNVQPGSLDDLPIVEVPCPQSTKPTLAIIISGDGGWAGIDSDMGEQLVARGIAVVGLDSLKYFWTNRTPEGTAEDLKRIIDYYTTTWHKAKIVLIGYSRGADVMSFLINRLPEDRRNKIAAVALLGLAKAVSFEFHLTDWISGTSNASDLPILPEINKLGKLNTICFYGDAEDDSLCPELQGKITKVVKMEGGHHFNGDYTSIVNDILGQLR